MPLPSFSQLLVLVLLSLTIDLSLAFSAMSSSSSLSSTTQKQQQQQQQQYPRPIHPGGFSLPPLVEDRLQIVSGGLQTNILLIKPPDIESLWEWYAYTKFITDSDPSWGRVWPTALSLSRFIIRALHDVDGVDDDSNNSDAVNIMSLTAQTGGEETRTKEEILMNRIANGASFQNSEGDTSSSCSNSKNDARSSLMKQAIHALQTTPHIVEVGCGLGVAGLAYACTVMSLSAAKQSSSIHSCIAMKESGIINEATQNQQQQQHRTITFLDKEPYAVHCCMSSCLTNEIVTGPIVYQQQPNEEEGSDSNANENNNVIITARAAIDDWTLPIITNNDSKDDSDDNKSQIKNVCYDDLHLSNENTIIIASDILYEPSTMRSLATKLYNLLHPTDGGYVLIADPVKERTPGCRDEFCKCIQELNGVVEIVNLPDELMDGSSSSSGGNMSSKTVLEGDMDIDGSLAKTVLIVVRFN